MNRLSTSVQNNYQFRWNPDPDLSPAQSGVYLTRNAQNQEWFRYFDASLGDWYASWAEMQTRNAHFTSSRILHAERAQHVVAWAHRARRLQA